MKNEQMPVFEIPPDGEPSEALLNKIKSHTSQGKPMHYLARMNRMPIGFFIYVKTKYLKS